MKKLRVPILMYHHVEPKPYEPKPHFAGSYVSRAEFSDQLDWLAERNFSVLSLADAIAAHDDQTPAAGRSVVLTFDDGCTCFLEHIVPELERRSMKATVFVVSGQIGGENSWDLARGERVERLLDAAQLRKIVELGFEVGCHTRTHRDLAELSGEALMSEVSDSKTEIEAVIGKSVDTLCYPFSHFNAATVEAASRAGYRAAVGVYGVPGVSRAQRYALPRAVVRPGNSRLEFKLQATGWYELWRRLPQLGLLSQLRRDKDGR